MALNIDNNQQPKKEEAPDIGFSPKTTNAATSGSYTLGLRSNLSINNETESFNKLFAKINEKVTEVTKSIKGGIKYNLMRVFKDNDGLLYSCIVLVQSSDDVKAHFAHILMVEKTGVYPRPIFENIGGSRYEILRVPGDALDAKMVAVVRSRVAEFIGAAASEVIVVDGTLVPSEFNVEDNEMVTTLTANTFASVDATYASKKNIGFVNIADVTSRQRNARFIVNMSFNNDLVVYDQTGMPVREDICLTLSYSSQNGNSSRSVNDNNVSEQLLRVFGYVDFRLMMDAATPYAPAMVRFVPNFVITHIETIARMPTVDMLLLAIATCSVVDEDNNWTQVFRSVPVRKGEIDYNDIGALNIEGNIERSPNGIGKKIDTKSKTFTSNELGNLINTLVKRAFMLSIDIPQAGPDTWYTSVFRAAAKMEQDNQAYAAVARAANELTNGNFTSMSRGNYLPIFTGTPTMIHGGYYRSRESGIRDLREMSSYLAVANYIDATNQNPNKLTMFTNTMYNTNLPNELLASERKKLIDEMTKDNAVYKQYHTRFTFSAIFLQSLVQSLVSAGFSPTLDGAATSNDVFQRRHFSDISGAIIDNGLRLTAQNTYANYGGLHGHNYSRYY